MVTIFLILFALLAFSACFSGLETALFSLSPYRRMHLKKAGGVAGFVDRILQKPREIMTTLLFGNELVNVAISIIAGRIAYGGLIGYTAQETFWISTGVTTLVILIFGEILPKNIAIRTPTLVSQVLAVPYVIFSWCISPLRWFFTKATDALILFFGGDPAKNRHLIVEEELRHLLEQGHQSGTLADVERLMFQNALDFAATDLFRVMIQRENIAAVPLNAPITDVLGLIRKHKFSRMPIYEGDLNHIVGILHTKDLIPYWAHPEQTDQFSLGAFLRPVLTFSPHDTLDHVFRKFQSDRVHMAIVKDATGRVIGLLTMDDVLRKFFPQRKTAEDLKV